MSKDELMDIDYDNLDYYGSVTRNLYKDIIRKKLYEEDSIHVRTRVLLDVIKYTVVLEEKVQDLKCEITELESED